VRSATVDRHGKTATTGLGNVTARNSSSFDEIAVSPLRVWFPVLSSTAGACLVFGIVFWPEINGALRVWSESSAYNHCYLVLPMAALLLWKRRAVFGKLRPQPARWAVLLLIPLAVAWLVAALLTIREAEQLTVVALFEVLLLAVIGWQGFRALLAPALFLFFLVPFGAFLVPLLQRVTAIFAITGLELLGIPVFADGMTIQIPEGYFEIAEACAGLRFLIASLVFGCFFATIVYRSAVRRTIFIMLSMAVPVIANGLRALGLILLAHLEGSAAAVSADHILYGWLFFSMVTLFLIAVGASFAERREEVSTPTLLSRNVGFPSPGAPIVRTMTVGLLIVIICPAFLLVIEQSGGAAGVESDVWSPRSDSDWVLTPDASTDWQPRAYQASRQATQIYHRGDAVVAEFVALYPLPARSSPLTASGIRVVDPDDWQIDGAGSGKASIAGNTTITINTMEVSREGRRRVIWWFYVVDGHATGSRLEAKLLQARTALERRSHLGALVAISTDTDEFARGSATLSRFFATLEPSTKLSPWHPERPRRYAARNDCRRDPIVLKIPFTEFGRIAATPLRMIFIGVRSGGTKSRHSVMRRYLSYSSFRG